MSGSTSANSTTLCPPSFWGRRVARRPPVEASASVRVVAQDGRGGKAFATPRPLIGDPPAASRTGSVTLHADLSSRRTGAGQDVLLVPHQQRGCGPTRRKCRSAAQPCPN